MLDLNDVKICIIGLGYVGLPLAVEFAKKYDVVGFDINSQRVSDLKSGIDKTLEVEQELLQSVNIEYTDRIVDIKKANIYIITVPTPIDDYKNPNLQPLLSASRTVGEVLEKDNIVIYESTVYPGCTEEMCVPILSKTSNLRFNTDFFVGYSPERINPGDKQHRVNTIKKVVSGSTEYAADFIDKLYSSIILAGTHKAPSIRVAEAAKVIENTQRDINIAFINELALIFDKLNIDTHDVLDAAKTKWNFLPFQPGLVGGHCIGVDPYYLTYKAKAIGYHPEIILAGRRLNDAMGSFVASQTIKLMIKKGHIIKDSKVLVLGITFKENCPDIRNSRAIDIITELLDFGVNVDIYDPWADKSEVRNEYNVNLLDYNNLNIDDYSAIVLAVAHNEFLKFNEILKNRKDNLAVFDVKGFLNRSVVDARL